ncbi:MAG TPA: D-alanyl-D-alanine carboxypeptidase/D-alanyl-D-alanine-endopeptidase [Solirubrobacteraceae bacterium]|nr:D-alanyl-D-alanine carboxypeptidase/D-alanyl-D-alanine-endopeptidase [Solirubrobacteraceae bacterium]
MLRRTFAALCACALLAGAPATAHAIGGATLRAKLAAAQSTLGYAVGGYVRDLTTGATLYERNPDRPLSPASNDKLLTTATALIRLGPDATFRTSLVAAADPTPSGAIDGDVTLVGGGDPYLTEKDLDDIAAQVAAVGVTRIRGRVIADASMLDDKVGSYDSGYAYDDDLGGRLSALQVRNGAGEDPPMHVARLLHKALKAHGIRLAGLPRPGVAPTGGVEIGFVDSMPLSSIVASINVPSDNYAAELLLKDLGARFGGAGTTAAGAAVVGQTMATLGIHPTIVDGSGLSRADRLTARQTVRLLTVVRGLPSGPALAASLPVAGRSGTLKDRLRNAPARGRCEAKTGTLRDVSSISGYCATTRNHTIVFSFLANGVCSGCAKRVESRMVTAIARYTD